ncbi:MAG: DNA topoisomerase I, partial [Bdellovibrionales bacterium]|nr:DNA topoisomerase I [Bdellovibrionales bacterium]
KNFGPEYLPNSAREYKTKVKNAQEAHEAIRPAGETFASTEEVHRKLGPEAGRLYELIWKRLLASQMKDAEGIRVGVQIQVGPAIFRASGKTITFPGFLRAYVEGSDDPEAELADKEKVLPPLKVGDRLSVENLQALGHETQPPARYTEGSLIKELERLGIGRPSTWATIVGVVLNRSYAFKRGTALVPTFLAYAVTGLLEGHFQQLMEYKFTADLEDDLDAIARGEKDSLRYLRSFFLGNGHPGLQKLVESGEEQIDPRIVCGISIGKTSEGVDIEVRIGRYGPFLSDGEHRASLPDDLAPDELSVERAIELLEIAKKGPESLGAHPETGEPVYLKTGRFGPYIQLGEAGDSGEKPKMASLLPGMDPADISLETAVQLLSLPRILGKNPENNEDIEAANGRYGPYIKCAGDTRTIPLDEMSPLTMTLDDALRLLKEPKRRGRGASQPKNLRVIGKHPVTEKELVIKSGRYGPYVTDGELNASLARGADPEALSLEDAVELLAQRAAKVAAGGGVAKKKAAKKSASKKAGSKKETSKKKSTAKKATSKKAPAKKKATTKKASAKKKSS